MTNELGADAVVAACFGPFVDSANRLPTMLTLLQRKPSLTWSVISEVWACCDATWEYRGEILGLLREQQTRPLVPDEVTWPLTIYRGCSRERVRGLSWTTSREVAEGFARGHRGLRVADPVIASSAVKRDAVFAFIGGRDEQEVLVDPRRLRQLRIVDQERPQ